MPKEIVVSHGPRFYDDGGQEIPQERQGLASVSWQRDMEHVQIVTFARDPVTLETLDADHAYHVTLDRQGINKLIRVLRRARDQAFGRDE